MKPADLGHWYRLSNFVPGSDKDLAEERPENGIFILPSDGITPAGMTYLVFRKTPPAQGGGADNVEYLGPFAGTTPFSAQCADANGNGPQSLYLVPVPVEREIIGNATIGWNLIEKEFAKALPGQKINLRLEDKYLINYGPGGITLDSFAWTIPNKNFKDYIVTYTGDNAVTSGILTQLEAGDVQAQEVHYYWTDSGQKEPSVVFNIHIASSQAATVTSKAKINVEKPTPKFDLVIGEERVDKAPNSHGDLVDAFGVYPKKHDVSPGAKFIGSVTMPSGWATGKWNWVQLIKSKRDYIAVGGAVSHLGTGTSFKLDTLYPYLPGPFSGNPELAGAFPADGSVPALDCIDTPHDPVAGRTSITVDETFETYLMFKPPGFQSRYVPLLKATWMWGGVATRSNNWNPIAGIKSKSSDKSGAEWTDHPQWSENTTSDQTY